MDAGKSRPGAADAPHQKQDSPTEAAANIPDPDIDLTDEEKLVLNLLQEQSPADLNELKGKAGLSNKKWDTAIKGLRGHNLVKLEKTDEGMMVELV